MFKFQEKKSGLFYIRQLQLKFYCPKNEVISALFYLEKFLFDNYSFSEEIPASVLKQKWLYEMIEKDDYSNEVTRNLKVFRNKKLKKNILNTIDDFSKIPYFSYDRNFFSSLNNFSNNFNKILTFNNNNNFRTSPVFQFVLLIYINQFKFSKSIENHLNYEEKVIDFFEIVFLKIFFKNYSHRISKSYYLYKLLLRFLSK